MEFKSLIAQRRSIRKYSDRPVPRDVMDRMLAEALTAPSARNTRTTRFLVVDNPALVARMADMRDYGSAFLKGVPAAVVVLGDTTTSDLWRENAAISATVLQLAAVDEGLGSCWGCMSAGGPAARTIPRASRRPTTCAPSCRSPKAASPCASLHSATPTSIPRRCPKRTMRSGSSASDSRLGCGRRGSGASDPGARGSYLVKP